MEANRIRPEDKVKVEFFDDNGKLIDEYEGSGFSNVEEAIAATRQQDGLNLPDSEAGSFTVTNLTNGTSRRYRLNAHGNVKLII